MVCGKEVADAVVLGSYLFPHLLLGCHTFLSSSWPLMVSRVIAILSWLALEEGELKVSTAEDDAGS